ncbi:hypothetical protein IMZ48_36880, partial [Candidatus Bathyarchaeota archaeon]|nr:hypothetical protein [Candidatus Bathyarchaeota archaeon]
MRPSTLPLPPSSSLPPLAKLPTLSEQNIFALLRNLSLLYCPLPVCASLIPAPAAKADADRDPAALPVDSGYTSETDPTDGDPKRADRRIAGLRADPFERAAADRWLAGFIWRAPTLHCLLEDEDVCERAVDQAAYILEALLPGGDDDPQSTEDGSDLTHELSFNLPSDSGFREKGQVITVRLKDRMAGENSGDHDDVGLQLWGASVVFSELICASPARFSLDKRALGPSPRIIDLGAGTGLVSLVLGTLLPRLGVINPTVIATDYHPAVLENLRANVEFGDLPVETKLLDWAEPCLEPPLHLPAQVLLATDVVYAPEHAVLLRDCASRLLASDGVFWLMITVRENGRFEGIDTTVEAAFAAGQPVGKDGRVLTILGLEELEKQEGIGRRGESGYKLFRIGWA